MKFKIEMFTEEKLKRKFPEMTETQIESIRGHTEHSPHFENGQPVMAGFNLTNGTSVTGDPLRLLAQAVSIEAETFAMVAYRPEDDRFLIIRAIGD